MVMNRFSFSLLAVSLLALSAPASLRVQDCNGAGYVCVDARFYRGFIGYSMLKLNFADTDTTRIAHGVDMVIDFPVVGAFAAFAGLRFDWHVATVGDSWLQGEHGDRRLRGHGRGHGEILERYHGQGIHGPVFHRVAFRKAVLIRV
jgi:hypothetical protein